MRKTFMKWFAERFDWIFLGVLFCVGVAATFSYGASIDTLSEQRILYANTKEYLLKLPFAEKIVSEYDEGGIIEISQNIERDHGIAAYYPMAWIWHVEKHSTRAVVFLWNLYTYLLVFGGGYFRFISSGKCCGGDGQPV